MAAWFLLVTSLCVKRVACSFQGGCENTCVSTALRSYPDTLASFRVSDRNLSEFHAVFGAAVQEGMLGDGVRMKPNQLVSKGVFPNFWMAPLCHILVCARDFGNWGSGELPGNSVVMPIIYVNQEL